MEPKREGADSLVPAPLCPHDSVTPGTTITITTISTTTMITSKTNEAIKKRIQQSYMEYDFLFSLNCTTKLYKNMNLQF